MSIPGSASPLFFQTAAGAAAAAGPIKSVRFNSADSTNLNRTFAAGNRKTFTLSWWMKRCVLNESNKRIFAKSTGSQQFSIMHNSNGQLYTYFNLESPTDVSTQTFLPQYRDPSAWAHYVLAFDTTQSTDSDRIKFYYNGVQVTDFYGTPNWPTQNASFKWNNASDTYYIGGIGSYYINAYLADMYHIDGQQLDCTSFGAFDDNGVWQAAEYSGTYGTNGFHLFDFANESGIGNDSSGNDNDFTVNNITSDASATGVSRVWSSGDTDWSITGSGQYASKSSTSTYADVFSNLLSPGTLYGFTVDIPDGDDNGGWWLGDSNSTSLSGTHPNQGRGSNSIGMRGRSASPDNDKVGVHGTFATANSVTAGNEALSGFQSINPYGATEIDFVVDRINHKCWVKVASNSSWIKGGDPTNPNSTPSFYLPTTGDMYFGFNQYDNQTNLEITQFSVTQSPGADQDVLRDVPTNGDSSDDTGAGGEVSGNYCVMNPLHHLHAATLVNGNLQTTTNEKAFSTFLLKTGKWYVEHKVDYAAYNLCFSQIDHPSGATPSSSNSKSIGWYLPNGYVYWGAGYSASLGGTTMTGLDSSGYMQQASAGDIVAAAIDMDNSTIKFYKNGSEVGSIDFSTGNAHRFTEGMYISQFNGYGHWNFGQRAYSYAAPSGYKALCTTNLPTPTIADGSDHFDVTLWTGNSGTTTISGLEFSPDWVWLKSRSATTYAIVQDTVRGYDKALYLGGGAGTSSEATITDSVTSFNSDGYTLGSRSIINYTGRTYVGWAWDAGSSTASNTDGSQTSQVRVNQTAGFSIATFNTPSPSAQFTYGHGLNAAPEFVIHKFRDTNSNWYVYHASLGQPFINLNDASAAGSNQFTTAPTSSVFTYPAGLIVGPNEPMVAYSFTSVAGYSAFGSLTTNGSADGVFVYTGFRPAFIIYRYTNTSGNWAIFDYKRNTHNVMDSYLYANGAITEGTSANIDFLSNGFKFRVSLASGNTIIYSCFAENPFQANGGLAR